MDIVNSNSFADCLLAAIAGSAKAQCEMGLHYVRGKEIKKSLTDALFWFRKSAEQNYLEAQWHMGMILISSDSEKKNVVQAVQWLHKAADQGHKKAASRLGLCYMSGEGVKIDQANAFKYFQIAEGIGDAVADLLLAGFYSLGEFTKQDINKAASLFKSAAYGDLPDAQFVLGQLYLGTGEIVERDPIIALAWLTLAASNGEKQAEELRNQVEGILDANSIDIARQTARKFHDEIQSKKNDTADYHTIN